MFCVGCTQTCHTNQTWTIPSTAPQPGHKGLAQSPACRTSTDPHKEKDPSWRGLRLTAQHWRGLAGRRITQKHNLEFKAEFDRETLRYSILLLPRPRQGNERGPCFFFGLAVFKRNSRCWREPFQEAPLSAWRTWHVHFWKNQYCDHRWAIVRQSLSKIHHFKNKNRNISLAPWQKCSLGNNYMDSSYPIVSF